MYPSYRRILVDCRCRFIAHTADSSALLANCHPERSEGSIATGRQMLLSAQHDKAGGVPNEKANSWQGKHLGGKHVALIRIQERPGAPDSSNAIVSFNNGPEYPI